MATTPESTPDTRVYEEMYPEQHHTFAKIRRTRGHPLREDQEDCSICLEPITDVQETLTHDTCKHSWHDECLEQWFKQGQFNCPLDREKLRCRPHMSYDMFVTHVCFDYIAQQTRLDAEWVEWAARTIGAYRSEVSELREDVATELGQQPSDAAVETVIVAELRQEIVRQLDREPDDQTANYVNNALGQVTAVLAAEFAIRDMDDIAEDLELLRHVLATLPVRGPPASEIFGLNLDDYMWAVLPVLDELAAEIDGRSNRGEIIETTGISDDESQEDDALPPSWRS